jgi:hypothetical protein
MKKTLIASSVALTLGAANAEAALVSNLYGAFNWSTDSANFTMLASNGGVVGGTNDVAMVWDGNGYSASSDYTGPGSAANVTAASSAPFFGHTWTAHDIQVFVAGTYTFDVTLGNDIPNAIGNPETGTLTATVGATQLGMHMLFDWNGNENIDVFVVANGSSIFGAGLLYSTVTASGGKLKCDSGFTGTITKNCLYDGPLFGGAGAPTKSQVWMMASTDPDGDGVNGIAMNTGGPFAGFNANFNATMAPTPDAVPVPAAVWLFGSGLLGLVGIARRKKNAYDCP